jgi:hypothetical protein
MSEVPEDRLDLDWIDYEGVIGYDHIEKQFTLQINKHLHWFDTKQEAEEYLVTHAD